MPLPLSNVQNWEKGRGLKTYQLHVEEPSFRRVGKWDLGPVIWKLERQTERGRDRERDKEVERFGKNLKIHVFRLKIAGQRIAKTLHRC